MIARKSVRTVLDKIVEVLVTHYQPEKIILFGSYAYGESDEDSDIDLFIIKDTDKSFYKRLAEVRRMVSEARRGFPFEPLVFTPQEIEERWQRGDPFVEEILSKGKVLYEQEKWFK